MTQKIESEQTIVSYLLGQLPDNTQEEVEQRFFRDEVYHDYLRAVEDDLIDDYARGELDSKTRTEFERRYLSSPERHQRVIFARAMVTTFDETLDKQSAQTKPDEERPSWWAALLASLRAPGFALQSAMALVLLGLLAAGVWMFVETRRLRARVAQTTEGVQHEERLRQQLADEQHRRAGLERQLQQLDAKNADEISKLRDQITLSDEAAARTRDELARLRQPGAIPGQPRLPKPTIASFVLLPGARDNSGSASLTVPSAAQAVNLQLRINQGDTFSSYRVNLTGAASAPVWSKSGLRARSAGTGRTVSINLPVKVLQENTSYELTLTGVSPSGGTEVLGYYYFKLVKQ